MRNKIPFRRSPRYENANSNERWPEDRQPIDQQNREEINFQIQNRKKFIDYSQTGNPLDDGDSNSESGRRRRDQTRSRDRDNRTHRNSQKTREKSKSPPRKKKRSKDSKRDKSPKNSKSSRTSKKAKRTKSTENETVTKPYVSEDEAYNPAGADDVQGLSPQAIFRPNICITGRLLIFSFIFYSYLSF